MGETIRIVLPATFGEKWEEFGLLLGTLWQAVPQSRLGRMAGLQDHIALEILAQHRAIDFRMWASARPTASLLARHTRAHFPEAQINPCVDDFFSAGAIASAELHLRASRELSLRTLARTDPDPMVGILSGLSSLGVKEWGVVQVLVRPTRVLALAEQAFECLIRLAVAADADGRAHAQLRGLTAAFGQYGAANALVPRFSSLNPARQLETVISRAWPPVGLHHVVLTRDELVAIYHFPAPSLVRNRRLSVTSSKRLPLVGSSGSGLRIGLATSDGRVEPLYLGNEALLRHLLLLGATGTGKSTLVCNLAIGLAQLGAGLTILDPHGSLVSSVADGLPSSRLNDVILVRFSDVAYPVGLNFLTARRGLEILTVDELVEVCQRINSSSYWGPLIDMMLRHAAYAALDTGGTLLEMARLLDDDAYRRQMIPGVRNAETRRFLLRLSELREGRREQQTASSLNRLQRFLGTPFIRNLVGQKKSTIDVRQIMDRRQILLVDLSGIGVQNARFLGSLLTLMFRQAALSRGDTVEQNRASHYLILDECSWYISQSIGEMADQARKFHLGLVLATQRLAQLKAQGTLEALLAETGSLVCFRMGDVREARQLALHLNTPDLEPEDIRSLGQYEVCAQLLVQGAKAPACWAQTLPAPEPSGSASERWNLLVSSSRNRHARPRQVVEDEIAGRERMPSNAEPEKRARSPRIRADET